MFCAVDCLNVYITHWRATAEDHGRLKSWTSGLLRLGVERLQVVGLPNLAHPIQFQLFGLGLLKVPRLRITIISNRELAFKPSEIVRASGRDMSETEVELVTVNTSGMTDPFELTWVHKDLIQNRFDRFGENDAFLYLEHDQLFTQNNLDYFSASAQSLLERFIRPSFIRIELSSHAGGWVYTDAKESPHNSGHQAIEVDEVEWIENPLPYAGMYLMAYPDMARHLDSPSCSNVKSRLRFPMYGTSERAALGNSFEGLQNASSAIGWKPSTTNFVAYNRKSELLDTRCFVWHISNRYGMNHLGAKFRGFGSVPVDGQIPQ